MVTGIAGSRARLETAQIRERVVVVPQPKMAICWPSALLFEGWW